MRVNIKNLPDGYKVINGKVVKTMALGGIPRTQANLEAEKGETALTDLDNDGIHELHTIGGNRHSNGGTPLNLPPQSFIFSDTAKMKFDKTELAALGIESTKKQTPAWVSKKHPLNKFIQGGADEYKDSISEETAELMLNKNKLQLSKIAFMQEAKKDFLDEEGNVHVPLAAYPFLISKGVNPEEFIAKLEEINNQKAEAQNQQGQGMPAQGGPMHQMPDGTMMPGAYHGAPQQREQGGGGDIEQLMQEIVQALQQGAQPEQIMQQLVQMGIPEEQAMQVLQQVMQGAQGQQGPPTYQGDKGSNEVSTAEGSLWNELQSIMGNASEGVGYNDQWDKPMSNDEARELYDWQMSLATGDSIPPGGVKNYFVQGTGPLGPTTELTNIPKISTTNRNYEDQKDSNLNLGDYLLDFLPGVDMGTRSHYDVWNPNAAPEKRNGGPIMKSGGGLPCLTCGGPVMGYGGNPFKRSPLAKFVYGGEDSLRKYQGDEGSSETFQSVLSGDDFSSVRDLWYDSYLAAIEAHNATAAGQANPISIEEDKEAAFQSFYTFDEMNNRAETGNLNYDAGCEMQADGSRPANCNHNDPNGGKSFKRMKKAGLIPDDMTADQYKANTRQFQVMYAALGEIKNNPDTPQAELDLLANVPIETSAEGWSAGRHGQHDKNVSEFDGLNGKVTSSSHVTVKNEIAPDEVIETTVVEDACPDAAAKQAECAARNAGGGATAPLFNSPPDVGRTGDLEPGVDFSHYGPTVDEQPEEPVITNPPPTGPATDAPVGDDEMLDQAQKGTETGGAWTWNAATCQCVQGPGTPKPGDPPKMIPWVQDQNNLAGAMRAKSQEEDFWPMMQKLDYNDADYTRNDPLTRIHAANSLAAGLGENATDAGRMALFDKAAASNREAVQNVQEADVTAYNRFEQANAASRSNIDAANSGFASKYVDDTNRVQAERIAKDQAHDANINTQNNALLTNMANTYNQNSLYPNYNVRPDYAGAIEFANPRAIRAEQSQTGNSRLQSYQEWKDAYPELTPTEIGTLMGKANNTTGGSGNQAPGGYQGPGTAKYGTEMRDLEANRKALRKWILGIQ